MPRVRFCEPRLDAADDATKTCGGIRVRDLGWRRSNADLACASCDKGVGRDQEVTLRYGWHPNRTLFVEYGFVNTITPEELMSGAYPGEVNVQDIVPGLSGCRGETESFVERTLDTEGYWGNWTMHCSPLPAHASFRLITALRLYHCPSAGAGVGVQSETETEEEMTAASRRWRDTILGYEDEVSEDNERACEESIREICEVIIKRAESGIEAVKEDMKTEGKEWYRRALMSVETLWLEELTVGKAMLLT